MLSSLTLGDKLPMEHVWLHLGIRHVRNTEGVQADAAEYLCEYVADMVEMTSGPQGARPTIGINLIAGAADDVFA